MQDTTRYFIVPGLGNSGPGHWQTLLEQSGPAFTRIQQREWDAPNRADWVAGLEQVLASQDLSQVVLIAHSLGCVTVAHWAGQYGHRIKGALLVAPSDVETAQYATFPTTGFGPMPLQRLPFPSKVITSTNDPWVSLERSRQFAGAWGSEFISIGPAGHINVASGHGPWPLAQELVREWLGPVQ